VQRARVLAIRQLLLLANRTLLPASGQSYGVRGTSALLLRCD